ncbi:g239 [Coccomyxa elongata]
MMVLASSFTAFILYVRPVLQRAERAALACESAAQELEKASVEMDKAAEVINTDMPTTLNAVERASIEFEELGRNLNMLSGPIRRAAVPALAVRTMGSSTGDGMRRIAQDVTALTQALTPAMEGWKKRIGRIATNFEAANKETIRDGSERPRQASAKPSVSSAAERAGQASTSSNVSSPHSVWTSFPDAVESGTSNSNAGAAEAAAARKEMVTAASGMMAEAGRLASDIISAEASTSRTEGKAGSKEGREGEESVSNAELSRRREAAQAVFAALFKAQEAAAAAAQASGELESALQLAERHAWSETLPDSNSRGEQGDRSDDNDGMGYSMEGRENEQRNGGTLKIKNGINKPAAMDDRKVKSRSGYRW